MRAAGRSMRGYESRREVDERLCEPPGGCWGARSGGERIIFPSLACLVRLGFGSHRRTTHRSYRRSYSRIKFSLERNLTRFWMSSTVVLCYALCCYYEILINNI